MNTTQNLYQEAQLAEAAYADFSDNAGNLLTNKADIEAALRGPANDRLFSDTQTTDFVLNALENQLAVSVELRIRLSLRESSQIRNGFSHGRRYRAPASSG